MIINFEFSNFQSFKELANISFESSAKYEGDFGFFQEKGSNLSKLLMVIGPNGGGKSNLLRALSFVTWFMQSSFGEIKPGQQIPVSPHFSSPSDPSTFKMTFIANKVIYEYFLALTSQRVLVEQLRSKNPKTNKFKSIFKRHFNDSSQSYDWDRDKELIQVFDVQDNASTISTGVYLKNKLCEKVGAFKISRNMQFIGFNTYHSSHIFQAGHFFSQNPDLLNRARNFLPKLDLGLSDFEIDAKDVLGPNQQSIKVFMPVGIHKVCGQDKKLEFLFESMGTQTALWLLQFILPVLEEGGVCILDELDTHLHPELFEIFLNLFLNQNSNPHNAQLIFTSHQHAQLNLLEKSQIQLVEKDKSCVSRTWRLSEMKGMRPDDNYAAKYRAGAYGAIPEVELI